MLDFGIFNTLYTDGCQKNSQKQFFGKKFPLLEKNILIYTFKQKFVIQ